MPDDFPNLSVRRQVRNVYIFAATHMELLHNAQGSATLKLQELQNNSNKLCIRPGTTYSTMYVLVSVDCLEFLWNVLGVSHWYKNHRDCCTRVFEYMVHAVHGTSTSTPASSMPARTCPTPSMYRHSRHTIPGTCTFHSMSIYTLECIVQFLKLNPSTHDETAWFRVPCYIR